MPEMHQWIMTNVTVSKVSGFAFIMVVYEKFSKKYFEMFLRKK